MLNVHKILILFLLFSSLNTIGQKTEVLKKRKLLKEIEKDKQEYYSNTNFNESRNNLILLCEDFFSNTDYKMYCNNGNELCFNSMYRAEEQNVYWDVDTKGAYDQAASKNKYSYSSREVSYLVCIFFTNNESASIKIDFEERPLHKNVADVNTPHYRYLQKKFNQDLFLYFMNTKIRGKWQPNTELNNKIEQYNASKKSERRKIKEEDYL